MKNNDQLLAPARLKLKYLKTFARRVSAKTSHLEKADKDKKLIARLKAELACISFKFRAVFDRSHSYYIILDRDMNILDFNRASLQFIKRLFGKKMVTGNNILDFIHPSSAKMVTENCYRALAGEKFTIERKVAYQDSEFTWWSYEFSPALSLKGNITGLVFNANDITKRKVYEEKIRSQQKKLEDIAAIQSHEVRGPVCTIMGLMSLIKSENYADEKEYLMLLEITTNMLDKNIRDIVALANEE
ncbi:MAG: sensor histidine kinase [Mucilaginibacter sp.]|jgi:PAS domain S-box-containing protein|nr:sensor histidine kinase [Mucilaginibacter sp.]